MEVPKTLADRPNWVGWKFVEDRKTPINPRSGQFAKTNSPETWSTLALAEMAIGEREDWDGLGFVFDGAGIFGIDLDGCRNPETGAVDAWALDILREFPTYAEVSPSQTGIKLWGLGSLSRSGKKIAMGEASHGKTPAIEVYDRGRYFCFTGERLPDHPEDLTDCQKQLDELLERLWPQKPAASFVAPASEQAGDKIERARAYLKKIPPAISGQSGHNVTFRAACVLVLGFDISTSEAMPLLQEWNAACSPPWTDKELWHKLTDADKGQGTRGYLLTNLHGRYDGQEPDIAAILEQGDPNRQVVDAKPIKHEFPVDCLKAPGFIGDVMAYTLATSPCPQPELAMAGALALLATITGRRIQDASGTRTNVYIVGVAPSGAGKEAARKTNKLLLTLGGADDMRGPERLGSHAGLISQIERSPASLLQLDEIGRLLETMRDPGRSPHLYNIGTVLMSLYTASDAVFTGDAYAEAKKVKTIHQPHPVIYGTTTPDKLWDSLTVDNVKDGFVGRLLAFESRVGYVMPQDFSRDDPPAHLVEFVRDWHSPPRGWTNAGPFGDAIPNPKVVPLTDEAKQRRMEHRQAIHERGADDDPIARTLWQRTGESAAKLALLHACSRHGIAIEQIDIEDVDWGVRMANYQTRLMVSHVERFVGGSEHEKQLKWVLDIVRRNGSQGLSRNELTRKTQKLRAKYRDEIIDQLLDSGRVRREELRGNGRPQTVFRFIN